MAFDFLLWGALSVAVIYDLKTRTIPNQLLVVVLLVALLLHLYGEGFPGLIFSVQGMLTGSLLLIIPFMAGGIGAGDVKLLGMVGALKGSSFVITAFLGTALWGGLIALILLAAKGRLKSTLSRFGKMLYVLPLTGIKAGSLSPANEERISYPYGPAIMLGVLCNYCSCIKVW
ncbi:MAG: A24 family peptidase [Syntrophomonas sp.]